MTRFQKRQPATIRIGIIGCGQISEISHVPAILASKKARVSALVDNHVSNARQIKQNFNIGCTVSEAYETIVDAVDAVVVATPNATHYNIAHFFLTHGKHVFLEKPMTLSYAKAIELSKSAKANGLVISVGYVTRFFPNIRLMKELIDRKFFGKIESFEYEFGSRGGWSPVSGYNLDKNSSGGGVLIVSGTHFLDRMIYWFGYPDVLECKFDGHSGVEANFKARFGYNTNLPEGRFQGEFFVSKSDKLRNRFFMKTERYDVEIAEGASEAITLFHKDSDIPLASDLRTDLRNDMTDPPDYFSIQMEDFLDSINNGSQPCVDGFEGSESIKLIAELYANPDMLDETWSEANRIADSIDGGQRFQKILVTGASGFVGGVLCERLFFGGDIAFRAAVHSSGNCARIARFPLDIVTCDLLNKNDIRTAMEGCDAVVNLARGGNVVDTYGFRNLVKVAYDYKVKKFVHLSSVAIYGENPLPGSEDESFPPDPQGNSYGRLKLRQETYLKKYVAKGLDAVILRPPNIYGPYSLFTLNIIDRIKRNDIRTVADGKNVCNIVHVYNLVDAILQALTSPNVGGNAYFITDDEKITWGDFFKRHIDWIDFPVRIENVRALLDPPVSKSKLVHKLWRSLYENAAGAFGLLLSGEFRVLASARIPWFAKMNNLIYDHFSRLTADRQFMIKRILKGRPRFRSDSETVDFSDPLLIAQKRKIIHSIDNARRDLGYRPRINCEQGMSMTEKWLKFAKIL